MTRDTRRAGALLVALGGVVAVLALMAGPASAQTSGGAVATDGSVASGDAHAARGSTASGDATAVNGSVASGCSTAINNSTASGDDCDRDKDRDKDHDKDGKSGGGGVVRGGGGVGGGSAAGGARPAATTTARLALTGSWSVQLTALAALAVAFGAVLMISASERRRVTSRDLATPGVKRDGLAGGWAVGEPLRAPVPFAYGAGRGQRRAPVSPVSPVSPVPPCTRMLGDGRGGHLLRSPRRPVRRVGRDP